MSCMNFPDNLIYFKETLKRRTVLMSVSRTLMAKAVPQANGCVKYSSVSGSSSSSWSKNCTFESFTE